MEIGDKGLIIRRGLKPLTIPLGAPQVGDKVICIPIGNRRDYVAIPLGAPQVGDTVALLPEGGTRKYVAVPIGQDIGGPCVTYESVPGFVNGDFETGLQSPWVNAFGGDHTTTIGSAYKHLGDYGCRRVYTSSSGGSSWRGLLQYDIEVQEDDYARLWFKNISDTPASIEFYRQTAPAHHHEWLWTQPASDGWKRHCFNLSEFLVPGIFRATLWTYANGVGVFENWWDDVEIIRAG